MTYLDDAQVDYLLRPINPKRVSNRDGMSHLEAYDVRATMNRAFDFCRWSADTLAMELLFETLETIERNGQPKPVVSVGYRAQVRLAVNAPDGTHLCTYTEWATGDASNFPVSKRADAHDFAIKTAESQAFKRCATNLGDSFGLSLYRKGSRDALVGNTIRRWAAAQPKGDESKQDVEAHVAEVVPENQPEPVALAPKPDPLPKVEQPSDLARKADEIIDLLLLTDRARRPKGKYLANLTVKARNYGVLDYVHPKTGKTVQAHIDVELAKYEKAEVPA